MSFWSDLGKAIASYFKALIFVFRHGLWYYFLFPLAISAALFLLGYYSMDHLNEFIALLLKKQLGSYTGSNLLVGFFVKKIMTIISSMLRPILIVVMGITIQYLVLLICSPLMGSLSSNTDRIVSGKEFNVGFFRFLFNVFRGILLVLRNILLQLLIMIPLALVFLLPVVGWLAVPLFFVFYWYFLGFNIMDYTYERRRISIIRGARFTRKHKGIAIGIGAVFALLLLVPYVGIALAVVLAPVASTMAIVDRMDNQKTNV